VIHRIARAALVACLVGLPLAACSDFDPTDLFDNNIFNPKKPLPGERKELFPDGTPGVPQGVPQDLYRGYQQPGQVGAAQGAAAQGAAAQGVAAQGTAAPPSDSASRHAPVNQGVTTDPRYAGAPEAAAPKTKPKPKPKPQVAAAPPPSKPTAITVNGASQGSTGAASPWPDPPPPQSVAPANSGGWPDPPPPSTYAH
jgi:hypothetical protein